MLEELRIAGLGVIEESVLELGPGFTAITGETGAGKTMVVSALGLLLGGRADSGAVRTGAGRARVESHAPAEPLGARLESGVPATALVELADQIQQARGRCLEMRGELGDLVAEAIECRVVDGAGREGFHGRAPFVGATLHPGFGQPREAPRATIGMRG